MKILWPFILVLMVIPLVLAVEEDNYVSYEVNTTADLKIRVANATDIVENAHCWLDIYRPNGSLVVNDSNMTYIARKYNYTYVFDEVGEWFVEYYCNNTVLNEIAIYGRDISIKNTIGKKVWEYENRTLTQNISLSANVTLSTEDIWMYPNRTLTNLSNVQPDITQAVWGGNYTINIGLLSQFAENVWNYVARYTHGEDLT